jgi:hypothetical protein
MATFVEKSIGDNHLKFKWKIKNMATISSLFKAFIFWIIFPPFLQIFYD